MANALRDSETRALGFSNAPVYDRRDLGTVGRGTADSYLSAIMAAPEWLLQKMMKDDPYKKGVLQSGPQDRMKAEQRRWEEYQANQAQNRDYAQGQDYGTGLGLVADPFLDALGAIPAVGKALKLQKGAKAKPINALSDLFRDEAGVLRAYHGTPHDVDKFKMANIGTGEGAQAYGHGLYFAEDKGIAEFYQEALQQQIPRADRITINGANLRTFQDAPSGIVMAKVTTALDGSDSIGDAITAIKKAPWVDVNKANTVSVQDKALKFLESLPNDANIKMAEKPKGNLYEVDLDVNYEDLLDWDAPLSKQPEKIQKILGYKQNKQVTDYTNYRDGLVDKYGTRRFHGKITETERTKLDSMRSEAGDDFMENISGQEAYKQLQDKIISGEIWPDAPNNIDLDALVSEYLRKEGAPGIKYYDASSRSAGEGSSNVVMFDENLINILGKD